MRLRNRRSTLVAAVVATGFIVSVQPALAQVVPTAPPIPPVPGPVAQAAMPAVPAWDASVGTACNIALTALGLGGLVAGGVPAMLPSTPVIDASVEARAALGSTSTAASVCFILPFRSVRTMCSADAQAEQELSAVGGQAGAPVNPGEFTPHFAGAAVDTAIELENAGAPAGPSSSLHDGLECQKVDLLAQPDLPPLGELGGLPVGGAAENVSIPGQGEGLATGLAASGRANGALDFADTAGSSGRAGSLTGGSGRASAVETPAAITAAPASQMSTSRKVVAGVLAGLIVLLLAYMCLSHASETQRSTIRS